MSHVISFLSGRRRSPTADGSCNSRTSFPAAGTVMWSPNRCRTAETYGRSSWVRPGHTRPGRNPTPSQGGHHVLDRGLGDPAREALAVVPAAGPHPQGRDPGPAAQRHRRRTQPVHHRARRRFRPVPPHGIPDLRRRTGGAVARGASHQRQHHRTAMAGRRHLSRLLERPPDRPQLLLARPRPRRLARQHASQGLVLLPDRYLDESFDVVDLLRRPVQRPRRADRGLRSVLPRPRQCLSRPAGGLPRVRHRRLGPGGDRHPGW